MNPLQGLVLALEAVVQTFGVRVGVEQPNYRTLLRDSALEVRQYPPRVVAETVVTGDEASARNAGFRKVAAYIFGDNRTSEQVAMTAPVAQDRGQAIAMTAPVGQTTGAGAWKIQFVMPSKYRLDTLPQPNDPAVRLVEEPAAAYAVLRFTGSRSPEVVAARTRALLDDTTARGWRTSGPPVAWFYDPPWTVPFLRRNEVAVRLERPPMAAAAD